MREGGEELTRSGLSRLMCDWLGWRSRSGRLREVTGRKALLELERAGHIELPPAQAQAPQQRARRERVGAGGEFLRNA